MTTTSRSSADEVISNVVIMSCIAEHLSAGGWWQSRHDFIRLSVVSKAWREVAARFLYAELHADKGAQLRLIPDKYMVHVR
jgi:hypothetical protein